MTYSLVKNLVYETINIKSIFSSKNISFKKAVFSLSFADVIICTRAAFPLTNRTAYLSLPYILLLFGTMIIFSACGDVGSTTIKEYSVGLQKNGNGKGTDISLKWAPPATSQSGSCSSDIDGYVIYYGTNTNTYTEQIPLNLADISCSDTGVLSPSGCGTIHNCSYTMSGLSPNEWFFSLKVIDTAGNESNFSNELSIIMP